MPFEELCGATRAVGRADYVALSERFHTLVLTHTPQLTRELEESARRFITLVDVLYDHRRLLVADTAVPLAALFGDPAAPLLEAVAWAHPSIFRAASHAPPAVRSPRRVYFLPPRATVPEECEPSAFSLSLSLSL